MKTVNDNVNPESFIKTINNNINVNINDNDNVDIRVFENETNFESIAQKLSALFHSDASYDFYVKVARTLPEHKIWKNYETATTKNNVRNPGGLFNWLCRKDMSIPKRS